MVTAVRCAWAPAPAHLTSAHADGGLSRGFCPPSYPVAYRQVARATSEWGADFNAYMKSLLICAKGDGVLSEPERDWVLGYCAALGGDASLVDELTTYTADDDLEGMISQASVANVGRGAMVFDAIRACDADGELAPGEMAAIKQAASALGLPEETVDRLRELYEQERDARNARNNLLYPNGAPL